jgi:hypothetical protein
VSVISQKLHGHWGLSLFSLFSRLRYPRMAHDTMVEISEESDAHYAERSFYPE